MGLEPLPVCGWPTFPSVLWCCFLGLLTCKTVSRITYTVLVETLNPAQSNPIASQPLYNTSLVHTAATVWRFSMKALARYQVILLGEQRHIRCEQFAQGCCPNNGAAGVEPATSRLQVRRLTTTLPSHLGRSQSAVHIRLMPKSNPLGIDVTGLVTGLIGWELITSRQWMMTSVHSITKFLGWNEICTCNELPQNPKRCILNYCSNCDMLC